jgi:hypothetical protein
MTGSRATATLAPTPGASGASESSLDRAPRPGRPTVDDMGEWSFPASDPPATWTWDVERQAPS